MKKVSELVNNKNYDLLKEFNQEKKNEDDKKVITLSLSLMNSRFRLIWNKVAKSQRILCLCTFILTVNLQAFPLIIQAKKFSSLWTWWTSFFLHGKLPVKALPTHLHPAQCSHIHHLTFRGSLWKMSLHKQN